MDDGKLLPREEVAAKFGISVRTLDRVSVTELPRVKLTRRRILFRPSDVEKYINSRMQAA